MARVGKGLVDGDGSWSWWQKTGLVIGGGVAVSAAAYSLYRYYRGEDSDSCKDEGFVDNAKAEEPIERKLLVLGLDGAGKSSVLLGLTGTEGPLTLRPNEGFNVVCLTTAKQPMALWEIGGAASMRKYWSSFIQDTRVLVYVVDSADENRLPEAFSELHRILGDERLSRVPIVIVANKQDLPGALDRDSVLRALAMDSVNRQRLRVHCVATEAPATGAFVGISELKTLLERLAASAN